jgi:hypothetical protein
MNHVPKGAVARTLTYPAPCFAPVIVLVVLERE